MNLPITSKVQRLQKPYNGSSGPNVAPDGDMIKSPAKQTAAQKENLPKEIVNAIAEKEGNTNAQKRKEAQETRAKKNRQVSTLLNAKTSKEAAKAAPTKNYKKGYYGK